MVKGNGSIFVAALCAVGLCLPASAFAQTMGEYGLQTSHSAPSAGQIVIPSPHFDARADAQNQAAAPARRERRGRTDEWQEIPSSDAHSQGGQPERPPSPSDNWVRVR